MAVIPLWGEFQAVSEIGGSRIPSSSQTPGVPENTAAPASSAAHSPLLF